MKRTIKSLISVIALSAILQPAAQENTVTITSFTDEVKDANLASDDNSITEIRFFDTAGRLRQTLRKGFSPDGSDLVDFIDFDSLGRKCTEFDPMPVGGNNGNFVGRSQFSSNGGLSNTNFRPRAAPYRSKGNITEVELPFINTDLITAQAAITKFSRLYLSPAPTAYGSISFLLPPAPTVSSNTRTKTDTGESRFSIQTEKRFWKE